MGDKYNDKALDTSSYIKLQELTESLFANTGVQEMLEIIEKILDRSVIITDMSFHVIAESPSAVNVPEYHYHYQDILFLDERSIELIRTHYVYKKMRERDYSNTIIPQPTLNTFLVASIKASSADVLMMIVFQDATPFDSNDLVLIKKMCQILSVEFQKENSPNRYRLSIPNHIISSLLSGKIIPRNEVLYKLSYIDWVSSNELYVMIIADSDGHDLDTRISSLVNALKLFIPTENCLVYEANIVVFLTADIYTTIYVDNSIKFQEFLTHNQLTCVTSLGFSDITNCRYYYLMARNALQAAHKFEMRLGSFQDMTYHIMADCLEKDYHIRDFCHPAVLKLLKYDYENHTELYPTLDCYLQHKDEPDVAANKLFIHRSTLFYRIKKIKELFGVNLVQVDELTSLNFSLRMLEIYGKDILLEDILNMDDSIYADSGKSTYRREYTDKISFCNDCYFFRLLEDIDCVPKIRQIKENTIITPLLSQDTLYEILGKYDEGKYSSSKLAEVFSELLSLLQRIEEKTQFSDYVGFDFDLLNSIILTEKDQLIFTTFERITYADRYDNYVSVIAHVNLYTFRNSKKKTWLISALFERYAEALDISQDTLKELVRNKASFIRKKVKVQKKMDKTTAVLLSGGKSSRMNYVPKLSLKIGNFTFFEHIVHTLTCFDDLLISNNESIDRYTVINDIHIGIGPIGGIYTALKSTKNPHIFITACDMPNISQELIEYLFEHLDSKDDCLIPVIEDRIHPLCAIYRRGIIPIIEAQINSENYKLRVLLENIKTHYLEIPEKFSDDLFNVNTFELYEEQLEKSQESRNFAPLTFMEIADKMKKFL
ncbi:MAG: NTP transferase domain-containing protein [Lachnospiraceae bacterium]